MTAQTILPANSVVDTGYNVANSVRFNSADSAKMAITFSGAGTSVRKATFSSWLKRSNLTVDEELIFRVTADSGYFNIAFSDADTIKIKQSISSTVNLNFVSTQKFRDPSAWLHMLVVFDTTQSTEGNRVKIYINGTQVTSWSTSTYPDQNTDMLFGTANLNIIGSAGSGNFFGGYLAEMCYCDGQSLTPTSFGEFDEDSGIWKPIDVSGLTFGTNGFYLDFEASGNLGNDANGGTDLTETNLAAADQATDTPTNNFATLNPTWRSGFDNDGTFSEGNCKRTFTSNNTDRGYGFSTMGVTAGKWYWEIKIPTVARASMGVGDANAIAGFTQVYYDETPSKGMQVGNGGSINENDTSTSYASSLSDDDIVMFALDMDNHRCYYGINGTWQDSGDPTSGATGTGDMTTQISDQTHINTGEFIFPFCFDASTSGQSDFEWNFGGCPAFAISSGNADGNGFGNFEYAPPSGYLALCTKNLGSDGG